MVCFGKCQLIPVGWLSELHVCEAKISAKMNGMGQISWHVQENKDGA